jgi:hypothetical protein
VINEFFLIQPIYQGRLFPLNAQAEDTTQHCCMRLVTALLSVLLGKRSKFPESRGYVDLEITINNV